MSELEPHGYKLKTEDIVKNSRQVRNENYTQQPITTIFKDKDTANSVKEAAKSSVFFKKE